MSVKDSINAEALADILQEYGIVMSVENIETVSKDFAHHLDMMKDMDYVPSTPIVCGKCKGKDQKIKELEYEVSVYNKSVKIRRKASHVWIENGDVKYEL